MAFDKFGMLIKEKGKEPIDNTRPANVVDPKKLTSKGLKAKERIQWTKLLKGTNKLSLDEAEALHKLIIKNIKRQLLEVPKGRREFIELAQKHGITSGIEAWLKKTDYKGGYREWKTIKSQEKSLRRALGEFLTTNPEFLNEQGLLQVLTENSERVTGDYLADYLKGWDSYFSGEKAGKVVHHQTLSSLREVLSNKDPKWIKQFNKLAEDSGFQIGDKGGLKIDPIAHKAFDRVGQDSTKWSVKGALAEMLEGQGFESTSSGSLIVPKDPNSRLFKSIKRLEELGAHSTVYRGTRGIFADKNLAKLSPENAFKSIQNVLGAEMQIGHQGSLMDKSLTNWKNWAKKKNLSLDEALDGLDRIIDKRTAALAKKGRTFPESIDSLIEEAEFEASKSLADRSFVPRSRYTPPNPMQGPKPWTGTKPPEPKGGILQIMRKAKKPLLQTDAFRRIALGGGKALASPVVGGEQMHALGSYAKTGDAVHLKDFGLATVKDAAIGSTFAGAAGLVAKRQLTRGLLKKTLLRGALGAVSGPAGWVMLGYTAYDAANQFTEAYTGTSINQRIGNLFINRPDDSITRVALGQF